ncbi:MAG TPA: type II secretion system F family protein [Acidimicrobiia bacterium]|jgi:tight adherence protein C
MPPVQVIIAAAAVALSIPLLFVSISRGAESSSIFARRAGRGEKRVTDLGALILEQGAGERVVRPALAAVAGRLRAFTPAGVVDRLENRIVLAGLEDRWPIERVLVVKVLGAAAAATAGWYLAGPLLALGAGGLAYLLPDFTLDGSAKKRQDQILRELPDAIDHITMSVEAGVGFEGAIARTARAGRGPMAAELRRALQEMQLGASRTQALRNLAARNDVLDLNTFIGAVVQSEEYGLPIANVLRIQASELRMRRKQRAEERALKIPVKIVFPLVVCIFPSLFIVLLGPAAVRVWRDVLS